MLCYYEIRRAGLSAGYLSPAPALTEILIARNPRPLNSVFTRGALSASLIRVSLTGAGADV